MESNAFGLLAVVIGCLGIYGAVHFVHEKADEHGGLLWGLVAVVTVGLIFGLHVLLTHGVAETAIEVSGHSSH